MKTTSIIKRMIPILAIALAIALTSCTSREEKVINGMKELQQRVEKHGAEFNEEQWGQVIDDYDALHEEAKRCDFTQSQLAELERVEGNLQGSITKESPKELGREVGKIIKKSGKMINDFVEGLKDGINGKYEEDQDE